MRALRRATRPPVLTLFAALNLLGSAAIGIQHLRSVEGPRNEAGELVTGDFLAFYTAGALVREGRGAELYDLEAQFRRQERAGRTAGGTAPPMVGWQPYVNPPLLAIAVAPLAGRPYHEAYRGFGLAMLLALVGALLLLRRGLGAIGGSRLAWWTAALLVASWMPLFRTAVGGQNTALTLLLLSGVCVAWMERRPWATGIFLGLLSYKPQYALLLGLALAARGAFATLGTAGVVAVAHYGLGALVVGPDWPLRMVATLRVWGELDLAARWGDISLAPALRHALPDALAWPLAALGIAGVLLVSLRWARCLGDRDPHLPALLGLLVAGTVIASPHLQYYDAGVLALPALLGVERQMRTGAVPSLRTRAALAAGYVGFPLFALGDDLGVQPLLLWPIALFVWHWNLLRRGG